MIFDSPRSAVKAALRLEGVTAWVLVAVVMIALIAASVAACGSLSADQGKAERTMATQGFTHIEYESKSIIGVSLQGCDQNDSVKYVFRAINPRGAKVKVTVCEGFLKGATIRGTE